MSIVLTASGGRHYTREYVVWRVMTNFHKTRTIGHIHVGDADGVDKFVREWADENGVAKTVYEAHWRPNGHLDLTAGKKRNTRMLLKAQPQVHLSFPGRNGTAHCRSEAIRLRVPEIFDIDDEGACTLYRTKRKGLFAW